MTQKHVHHVSVKNLKCELRLVSEKYKNIDFIEVHF